MLTTLGHFLNSLQRNTYFVAETEPDGSRYYYPIEDLESIPGGDQIWTNPITVLWMDEHTAIISNIRADGLRRPEFPQKQKQGCRSV